MTDAQSANPGAAAAANLTNRRKAAILIRILDEETAAEVMKLLNPKEIQDLSHELAFIGPVTHEELYATMSDFFREVGKFANVAGSSMDYIRSILVKVLGEEGAHTLLDDIAGSHVEGNGIDSLNVIEPIAVAEMIRGEHPQIIATILVHLKRNQSSLVLEKLDKSLRENVMMRIATFNGVQQTALTELSEILGSMLEGQSVKRAKMGGVKVAAEMLNLMNNSTEEEMLDSIREANGDLAQSIVDNMFLFENILDLDPTAIRSILAETSTDSLAVALKGCEKALVDKFVAAMSERASRIFVEELEGMPPVRISQVEEEQRNILQLIKRLAESGDIVIGGSDDAFV